MLDPKLIREQPELVKKSLTRRKSTLDVDYFLELDTKRRTSLHEVDTLRASHNRMSDEIRNLTGEKRENQMQAIRLLKDELAKKEEESLRIDDEFQNYLIRFPNLLLDDVPSGKDESENVVIRSWGTPRNFDFTPKDHVALGDHLHIIDIPRAAKVSGSRFAYLKGKLALLQFALVQHTLSILTNEKKIQEIAQGLSDSVSSNVFIPVIPPVFIRPEVYGRMARLEPKEERYYIQSDDQYLIGSAEHTLGPLHMDEILDESQLPLRYVGYSTSFRREAGSYGKDTHGILRVHQFDKLEMESFTTKEDSSKEQDFIVAIQEYLIQSLGIPYQVVMICTGDIGTPNARQIDLECWIPSQGVYRETHTSDLNTDYQARRLNTKVRRASGVEFVHMNDATAFALGRILIAICENYQLKDGSIEVPTVLRSLCGFEKIEKNNS